MGRLLIDRIVSVRAKLVRRPAFRAHATDIARQVVITFPTETGPLSRSRATKKECKASADSGKQAVVIARSERDQLCGAAEPYRAKLTRFDLRDRIIRGFDNDAKSPRVATAQETIAPSQLNCRRGWKGPRCGQTYRNGKRPHNRSNPGNAPTRSHLGASPPGCTSRIDRRLRRDRPNSSVP